MKKLILLLLFIPLVSFGQIKYKDLIKIDSQEAFEKLMFDEQFSTTNEKDDYGTLFYALDPKADDDGGVISTKFATYTPVINKFFFTIIRTGTTTNLYTGVVTDAGVITNDYDTMLRKAKRKCKFVKMFKPQTTNYACYSCKDADFEGYLAFGLVGGQGVITNIMD